MKRWLLRKINGKVKVLSTASSDPFDDLVTPTVQKTASQSGFSMKEILQAISQQSTN
jgi:hypothetical protein